MQLMRRLAKRYLQSQQGAVAIIVGLSLSVLMIGAGVAVDMARAQMVQTRLQGALDASGLAALSSLPNAPLNADKDVWVQTEAQRFFNMNFPNHYMDTTDAVIRTTLSADGNSLAASASVTQGTSLMKIVGVDSVGIGASTRLVINSNEGTTEVILVLDNTESMNDCAGTNANCAGLPQSKLGTLKTASNELLDILYGTANDTAPGLYVGIIPFAQAVNVGTSHVNWLQMFGPSGNYLTGAALANAYDWGPGGSWGGCVTAPYFPYAYSFLATADYAPNSGIGYNAYWNPPEPGRNFPFTDGSVTYPALTAANGFWWNYNPVTGNYLNASWRQMGWRNDSVNPPTYLTSLSPITYGATATFSPTTYGPNYGCPQTTSALARSKATAKAAINAMYATGDTIINEGMAWGYRMLSPNWRNQWGGEMDTNLLPSDYPTPTNNIRKVVILMSDGWNSMKRYNYTAFGYTWNMFNGFAPANWMGDAGVAAAENTLNGYTDTICTTLKNNGVIIYTIGFGTGGGASSQDIGTVNTTLLSRCATDPAHYFLAPTNEQLRLTFQQIGRALLGLRVSK